MRAVVCSHGCMTSKGNSGTDAGLNQVNPKKTRLGHGLTSRKIHHLDKNGHAPLMDGTCARLPDPSCSHIGKLEVGDSGFPCRAVSFPSASRPACYAANQNRTTADRYSDLLVFDWGGAQSSGLLQNPTLMKGSNYCRLRSPLPTGCNPPSIRHATQPIQCKPF